MTSTQEFFSNKKTRDGETRLAKRVRERREDKTTQQIATLEGKVAALIKDFADYRLTTDRRIQALERRRT